MTHKDEQGVALVITLFLMGAMSALGVSMMFLAQTETSASRNYRTMSQARYAGEAGVHRALHYLSSAAHTPTIVGMDTTVSPVTLGGNPVVLTPLAANSNHPDSAVKNAYAALFTGAAASLSVGGGATVTYEASATLLSARSVNVFGVGQSVVETWRINAVGKVPGTLPATVEVAALLERDTAAAESYAIFATGAGCGAITMAGNVQTDSYDSTTMTTTPPTTQPSGGAVGTNGNLSIAGNVTINGNLDTPRTGVGNCNAGTPTAFTGTGQATLNGDIIQLPQAKVYPTPSVPSGVPTAAMSITSSTTCLDLALYILPPATCGLVGTNLTITANGATIALGNVAMSGGMTLTLQGGTSPTVNLNVNTFSMAGNSSLVLGTGTSVVMNVVGAGVATSGTVLDFTGGTTANSSYDPSKFQILYAGTSEIKMVGGSSASGMIYAPNAHVVMHGNADFYGSVLSKTFRDTGGASVHYDRSLANKLTTLGSHVMSSFSWQKY